MVNIYTPSPEFVEFLRRLPELLKVKKFLGQLNSYADQDLESQIDEKRESPPNDKIDSDEIVSALTSISDAVKNLSMLPKVFSTLPKAPKLLSDYEPEYRQELLSPIIDKYRVSVDSLNQLSIILDKLTDDIRWFKDIEEVAVLFSETLLDMTRKFPHPVILNNLGLNWVKMENEVIPSIRDLIFSYEDARKNILKKKAQANRYNKNMEQFLIPIIQNELTYLEIEATDNQQAEIKINDDKNKTLDRIESLAEDKNKLIDRININKEMIAQSKSELDVNQGVLENLKDQLKSTKRKLLRHDRKKIGPYNSCPNNAPYDDCNHEDLKRAYLKSKNEYRMRGEELNSRILEIQKNIISRRNSIVDLQMEIEDQQLLLNDNELEFEDFPNEKIARLLDEKVKIDSQDEEVGKEKRNLNEIENYYREILYILDEEL